MFYNKFIFLFLHLSVTLCIGETASVTPRLHFDGEEATQDPETPAYIVLAENSLKKYLQTTANTETYKVKKIERVVAGIKTTIDFTISPIKSDSDTISCKSIILGYTWENLTDFDVTCEAENQASRTKKEAPIFNVESETVKDRNDSYYKKLAVEALQKYLHANDESRPHKVISIIKATEQTDNGIQNTHITFVVAPETEGQGRNLICFLNIQQETLSNHMNKDVYCITNGVSYPD